jgi:Flp pilus assembly protein TadD
MSPWFRRLLVVLLVPVACAAAGCARREAKPDAATLQTLAQAKEQARAQARSQELIEAGNALFRARDYVNAAKRYAAAAVVKDDDPAAYYGLGMALARLGRDEEARDAYARAREVAQQAREGARGDSAR